MDKKTKVVLAAVAGILALGFGLSAVSCAVRGGADSNADPRAESQAPVEAQEGSGQEAEGLTAYERACITAWEADDGSKLQISKGLVAEADAKGALHVLTVSESSEAPAGEQTLITVTGMDGESGKEATWTLVLDESDALATVFSDSFKASKTYRERPDEGSLAVTGVDEGFLSLVGGDVGPLETALKSFMAEELPQATSASFDGQALVDYDEGSVSATFHSDDPGKTVVTVIYRDGVFSVSR